MQGAFFVLEEGQVTGLQRRQAPGLSVDPVTGVGTLITATGQQLRIMGGPPDLGAFLDLLRPFGVTGLTIQRGQFVLRTASPELTGTLRLDFALRPGSLIPSVTLQPAGTAEIIYPGSGRRQAALPVFADVPGFLATAAALPGVSNVQAQADGTVTAIANGQPVRVRPDFTVGRSPGTSKRILADGESLLFEAGDGRRQRFTIVP